MGRFMRSIRGFFSRFLTGVEQRNPEILLENAVQDKQEAQASLQEIEGRLDEARHNSEEIEQAFREQERRYNDIVRERAALLEAHQRSKAERELETMEIQMGLRPAASLEAGEGVDASEKASSEQPPERGGDRGGA